MEDLYTVREAIDMSPTVDAAPVVRGKWNGGRFNERFTQSYEEKCSNCGYWSLECNMPYCPNCGARMDLEL
jgi:uncharacterized OB-fold protein